MTPSGLCLFSFIPGCALPSQEAASLWPGVIMALGSSGLPQLLQSDPAKRGLYLFLDFPGKIPRGICGLGGRPIFEQMVMQEKRFVIGRACLDPITTCGTRAESAPPEFLGEPGYPPDATQKTPMDITRWRDDHPTLVPSLKIMLK